MTNLKSHANYVLHVELQTIFVSVIWLRVTGKILCKICTVFTSVVLHMALYQFIISALLAIRIAEQSAYVIEFALR